GLTHRDGEAQLALSRWHFELRRTRRGHLLRRMSSQLIEVDGRLIEPGEEAQVRPGTTVRLAQVMTLRFLGSEQTHSARDAVTIQHGTDGRMRRMAGDDTGEISTAPPHPPRA